VYLHTSRTYSFFVGSGVNLGIEIGCTRFTLIGNHVKGVEGSCAPESLNRGFFFSFAWTANRLDQRSLYTNFYRTRAEGIPEHAGFFLPLTATLSVYSKPNIAGLTPFPGTVLSGPGPNIEISLEGSHADHQCTWSARRS
jgi:hypothetical protein